MDTSKRGRFLTLEGIEGVGKSTNLAAVADLIRAAGHETVVTREPGGTPVGELIRQLLLEPGRQIPSEAELLLMFAARSLHLADVIRPALARGAWVVCDRFTDASYAYQGGGRKIPTEHIAHLEQWIQGDLRPDLTLLLDAPTAAAANRQAARGNPDRFEQEQAEFFQAVRNAYLARAAATPDRMRVVNAARPLADVQDEVRRIVSEFIGVVA